MSLLASEITRIKYELGWNTLAVGADPYVGVSAIFEQVIGTYSQAGAVTSSSTTVAAGSESPTAITLASATGFATWSRVVVDVDCAQEIVSVQAVAGNVVTVQLALAHSGSYPVTVEGGESIIRELLRQLYKCQSDILAAADTAGLKKVDEVEFFPAGSNGAKSRIGELQGLREYLRDELCIALFGQGRRDFFGQPGRSGGGGGGGFATELY